ncbi:MAG TPA: DUF1698 domain-containing protein [Bryobacteraceae bacterium]|nr:DUF1698 domain-containing protein [Bryobacteraceae bacterium]
MSSPEPHPLAYIREWRNRLLAGGWWHSFELPDGTQIRGVSELDAQKRRIAQFPIPQDLSGKRVLDVGAWDGWFSFEMERRGAEVVAIDRFDNPRFHRVRDLLGSRVEYRQLEVYDVSPRTVGTFDIVLFMGVFYHLRHPLLGLERVCSVTREFAALESFVLTEKHGLSAGQASGNLLQFFEDDDFGGEVDNWFAPTAPCLAAICRAAGFARAELANHHAYGAAITCYRDWGSLPGPASSPAPQLLSAVNPDTYGINFQSTKDEYVTCRVAAPDVQWSRDSVFPEIDGHGVRPMFVGEADGVPLVVFKLPPALVPGWHEVRLRTIGSRTSAPLRIAVDFEAEVDRLEITGACDGITWSASQVSLANRFLSLWVRGLPENADIGNVQVRIDGRREVVDFVGAPDGQGLRQVNVRVAGSSTGVHRVAVGFGEVESAPVEIDVIE